MNRCAAVEGERGVDGGERGNEEGEKVVDEVVD